MVEREKCAGLYTDLQATVASSLTALTVHYLLPGTGLHHALRDAGNENGKFLISAE